MCTILLQPCINLKSKAVYNAFKLRNYEAHLKRVVLYVPAMLGNEAVNFFTDSFRRQGWLGDRFEPWRKRKVEGKRKGRAILIDRGRLRRATRIASNSGGVVVIGNDTPYAAAHNNGFRGTVTATVREHKRKSMSRKLTIIRTRSSKNRTGIEFGKYQTGEHVVRQHTRTQRINLPQRRFMGNSPYLRTRLTRILAAEINKGLR